ncbi:GNAT family N-acetyltransferase [Thermus thermophilus]|uniref:GNAT family N-acetyltransferase n=1 Tax=Thermus thermophilus TaxID=274 RepID=UPI0013FD5C4E|nr:GNAT family N-acetyltransferase [Thermus thermophilus]
MRLWERAPLRLRRYLVYRREGGWPPLALGPSVTVERLGKGLPPGLPEEVRADGRVYPLARTLEGYLALGHPGVVLRVEGRYAGHLFLRPPGTPPPPHLPWGFLPEPLPWAYGAFVRPEYRGRGLIRHALVALGRGWEEVYAEVRPENLPARRSLEALGFRPVGWLEVLILGVPKVRWWRFARFRAAREGAP